MDNPCYRVRDWDRRYETAETRKLKTLRFVYVPNRHDGLAYRRLVTMANGLALFGAWILMLEVASRAPRRGLLTDEHGEPLTAEDLALMTGAPANVLSEAIRVLSSPEVRWIESVDLPASPGTSGEDPGIPGTDPDAPGSSPGKPPLEEKGIEGKEGKERTGNGSELDTFDASSLSERLYTRHPKKAGRVLAEQALAEAMAASAAPERLAMLMEERHAAWCSTHDWRKDGGRFSPKLSDWIRNQGWLDDPPETGGDPGDLPEWKGIPDAD